MSGAKSQDGVFMGLRERGGGAPKASRYRAVPAAGRSRRREEEEEEEEEEEW